MDLKAGTCHVAAIPFPGRGHINPMLNLCHLLASRRDDLLITLVLTEEWLGFIGSEPKPSNLHCLSIPNVLPLERERAARFEEFMEAVRTKMQEPCERLLDGLSPRVTAIVADSALNWAVGMGSRRKTPVAFLFAMSASVFNHFDYLILEAQNPERDMSGEEHFDLIGNKRLLGQMAEGFSLMRKVQFLLSTSIYELEARAIDALKVKMPFPVYPLGPLIPYYKLGPNSPSIHSSNNGSCLDWWLDSQPPASVLYVSFGSFLSVSSAQMEEIAVGLRQSGVRFLWVARADEAWVKDMCGEMGLVVAWCDQLRVLCHGSVVGFWSHCGWSSVMEGVFAGLPFLTFPIGFDQRCNSEQIVEDWKIGWKVRGELGKEALVERDEIASLVRRFMDLESNEGNEMRRRARELQEISRRAAGGGGSSSANLDAFTRDLLNSATLQAE